MRRGKLLQMRMVLKSTFSCSLDMVGRYCALVSAVATGVVLVFMVLLITVDTMGRNIFSRPTYIADEAGGYMVIAVAFLGLAAAELAEKHVEVHFLTRRLSQRSQERLEVAILAMTLVFIIWYTWILCGVVSQLYVNQTRSRGAMHMFYWIPFSTGPLGMAMFAMILLVKVAQKLHKIGGR